MYHNEDTCYISQPITASSVNGLRERQLLIVLLTIHLMLFDPHPSLMPPGHSPPGFPRLFSHSIHVQKTAVFAYTYLLCHPLCR